MVLLLHTRHFFQPGRKLLATDRVVWVDRPRAFLQLKRIIIIKKHKTKQKPKNKDTTTKNKPQLDDGPRGHCHVWVILGATTGNFRWSH